MVAGAESVPAGWAAPGGAGTVMVQPGSMRSGSVNILAVGLCPAGVGGDDGVEVSAVSCGDARQGVARADENPLGAGIVSGGVSGRGGGVSGPGGGVSDRRGGDGDLSSRVRCSPGR